MQNTGIRDGDIIKIVEDTEAVDIATKEVTLDLKKGVVGTVVGHEMLLKLQVGEKFYLVGAENARVEVIPTIAKHKGV